MWLIIIQLFLQADIQTAWAQRADSEHLSEGRGWGEINGWSQGLDVNQMMQQKFERKRAKLARDCQTENSFSLSLSLFLFLSLSLFLCNCTKEQMPPGEILLPQVKSNEIGSGNF